MFVEGSRELRGKGGRGNVREEGNIFFFCDHVYLDHTMYLDHFTSCQFKVTTQECDLQCGIAVYKQLGVGVINFNSQLSELS